jgi:hypothetical protein
VQRLPQGDSVQRGGVPGLSGAETLYLVHIGADGSLYWTRIWPTSAENPRYAGLEFSMTAHGHQIVARSASSSTAARTWILSIPNPSRRSGSRYLLLSTTSRHSPRCTSGSIAVAAASARIACAWAQSARDVSFDMAGVALISTRILSAS